MIPIDIKCGDSDTVHHSFNSFFESNTFMSTENKSSSQNSFKPSELDIINQLTGSSEQVAAGLRLAAEEGHAEAQTLLGQVLLDGQGVAVDQAQALQWFKAASHSNHPMAINMVGRCIENGWGVEANPTEAAQWFKRAAELGLNWGMYNYANLLARGTAIVFNSKTTTIYSI